MKVLIHSVAHFSCIVFMALMILSCSEKASSPDFANAEWKLLRVSFCTENASREVWQTRDKDKLELFQGALTVNNPEPIDHVIKSHNHAIDIVLATEQGAETWQFIINLDQNHVSFYQVSNPLRSFTADSDAMFYRAVNTLLKSHMSESLDIFRKCELAQ